MLGKSTEERIKAVNCKYAELMNIIIGARCGEVMEFDYVQKLIQDIHKDEVNLISIIADMEFDKCQKKERELDIPKFMSKENKGA